MQCTYIWTTYIFPKLFSKAINNWYRGIKQLSISLYIKYSILVKETKTSEEAQCLLLWELMRSLFAHVLLKPSLERLCAVQVRRHHHHTGTLPLYTSKQRVSGSCKCVQLLRGAGYSALYSGGRPTVRRLSDIVIMSGLHAGLRIIDKKNVTLF